MTLEVGSQIAYTADFVRNVGGLLYEIAERRGTVLEVQQRELGDLAVVQWNDEDEPKRVRVSNICPAGSARMYA